MTGVPDNTLCVLFGHPFNYVLGLPDPTCPSIVGFIAVPRAPSPLVGHAKMRFKNEYG
jgi:hypothetical protein